MADGQVVFEITADGKKAIANIKDLTKAIQTETDKWDDAAGGSAKGAEDSWKAAVGKITGAISAAAVVSTLTKWGKAAIEAASDLQEVQNVVDVTFGDGASKIEEWSKKAGKQFGLTETQAKKFTSTLGAMMKSAGMTGDEIVDMSTDLAGLAADMASFYNLDFETAFSKIRAGISGETEPLKQLGINMSVASLEAYALEQGITKSFNAMSQGEQTILRYKYLMQATADAQGDFARTSDGFANASRIFQTQIETLRTKLGVVLLPVINDALVTVNKLMEALTATPEETLFDKINAIEIDTNSKIADINNVAEAAGGLIEKLTLISGTTAGEALKKMAVGANELDSSSPNTWKALSAALKNVDGLQNIESLATALSGAELGADKVAEWQTFLGALSENADALTSLTGTSGDDTKKWLEDIAEAANSIDANDVNAWDKLLTTLVSGFSSDTPQGQQFVEGLTDQFLAMGNQSEAAASGLAALGYTSDQITDKQNEWLKTCKQLVQTIPALSAVINTETGEVTGGTGALQQYVEEWKTSQEKLVYWKAYYAKKAAQQETENSLYSLEIEAGGAQTAVENYLKEHPELSGLSKFELKNAYVLDNNEAAGKLMRLLLSLEDATEKYTTAQEQNAEETEKLSNEYEWLTDKYGEVEQAELDAEKASDGLGNKTASEWQTVTDAVKDQIKALADYVQSVHDATAQNVNSTVKSFDKLARPTTELEEKRSKLIEQQNALNRSTEEGERKYQDYQKQIDELNNSINEYSPKGMMDGLKSQLAFMDEYMTNLEKAQKMGLSDSFLAFLADGSIESAEYLAQLVANPEQAAQIDAMYQQVQEKKKGFVDALTEQKLTVDETYQSMVDKAKEAIGEMDLGDDAESAMENTVQGLADGIANKVPAVASAVEAVITELNRLSGYGISVSVPTFGKLNLLDGEHETGLDYVPFDGYLAGLHQGEGILTAEENRIWQRFKNGGVASRNIDYDALGAAMRDNVKAGGNVYLDGRVVGSVISKQQGNSYRALERSGWQQ